MLAELPGVACREDEKRAFGVPPHGMGSRKVSVVNLKRWQALTVARQTRLACLGGFLLAVLCCAAAPAPGPGFIDIQASLPGLANAGAAWGDFDNDGDLDLVLVGFENLAGDRLDVWRNQAGVFTRATLGLPQVAYGTPAWGDYDGDGDLDLALLTADPDAAQYATEVWRNDGSLFTRQYSIPIGRFAGKIAWTDFDADGDLDLIFNGQDGSASPLHILRNDSGSFVHLLAGIDAETFALADVDGDGDVDVAAQSGSAVRFFSNQDGQFIAADLVLPEMTVTALTWADYDRDNDLDLLDLRKDRLWSLGSARDPRLPQ